MSFAERAIDLTITLQAAPVTPANATPNPNPTFAGTAANTVKITGGGPAAQNGLRISAQITKAGGNSFGQAQIRIFNLPLEIMNQLSTLGTPLIYQVGQNLITVEAGDADSGMAVIFKGTITAAWADPNSDAVFNISAFVAALSAAAPAAPASYSGSADVATILASLATQAGFNFENNGVTARLSYPYLAGSVIDQIKSVVAAAGIEYFLDDVKNVLAIWPKGGSRGGQIPLVKAGAGLVGYPHYTANGIALTIEFNPSIGYGSQIQVESILTPASGKWTVYYLDYDLECQEPSGPWFINLEAAAPGYTIVR